MFSRADTRPLGWSDPALTRAVRRGHVLRLRRDQFTIGPGGPVPAAIAAARGCRRAVISHRSAALLHGLPLVGPPPPVPEVTVPPYGTGDLEGAHLHRATLREVDLVEVSGDPVTSVPRTIIDLGRHRPIATMVAAADFALHEGLTTLDDLTGVLASCKGWYRIDRAARGLTLLDGSAESPLESISRLSFAWLRLPPPKPQQRIGSQGVIIARADFYWDEFGVVGEADGKAKLRDNDDLVRLKDRQEMLEDLDLVVVRWGWTDVVRTPRLLDSRIRRAFERGQRRDALGFPRRWHLVAA